MDDLASVAQMNGGIGSTLPCLLLIAAALILPAPAQAASPKATAVAAIRAVFGKYASQAIRVVDCETGGTFSTTARNGQYLGLFQMGSWERRTYGHGSTALAQARAAYRYFAATGYDWSPWACKPW